MEAIEKKSGTLVRPLKVLVPLIKEDLQHGREAAERAGMPYYRAAGEKFIEAKSQLAHGEFLPWVQRNFGIKKQQASLYMALAEHTTFQKSVATDFSSLSDFERETGRRPPDYNTFASRKPEWQEPVREVVSRVNIEALALERQNREKENRLIHQLAIQLIDIGYRVLAAQLHPDKKGGSADAMRRLNEVRRILKNAV